MGFDAKAHKPVRHPGTLKQRTRKIFYLHSSGDKSMFKHLVPVVAVALIAGPAFAQSAAAPAPAAAPAAAAAAMPAEKAPAKSSTHHKKHHHHHKAKAAASTAADTAPAK
ncbi:MAG: hypothetical protein ACHQD6_04585 [Steroidobacterales bacterium]|jgi:hypothetical protein